jgi:hypothetical protein
MRYSAFFASVFLVAAAAGCGGSGGATPGANGGSGQTSSKLVVKVQDAKAKVDGKSIVASAKITEGGMAGEHLSLRYGLVDAVSGVRASEEERLAVRYTTTSAVDKKDVSIRFPKPDTPTDYLLHFVMYGPDGSYLASSDSPVFTVQ